MGPAADLDAGEARKGGNKMFFATHEVMDHYGAGPELWAFKTRAARDSFVKHGPRGCWSLVFPYEQRAITAKDARKVARRDDYGDAYAIDGDAGGVLYLWGSPNYDRVTAEMEV